MNLRVILVGGIALSLVAGCSIEEAATAEEISSGIERQARVRDRVIEVVCDPDSRTIPEELAPLVQEVRARDGRSDRVWEVADQAPCIAGPAQDTAPTP